MQRRQGKNELLHERVAGRKRPCSVGHAQACATTNYDLPTYRQQGILIKSRRVVLGNFDEPSACPIPANPLQGQKTSGAL